MPTPSFCSLEEVYGDWNFKKPETLHKQQKQASPRFSNQDHQDHKDHQDQNLNHRPQLQPITQQEESQSFQSSDKQDDYRPTGDGLRSFCPNCNNCVKANDVLQQRIIEQNIWPRPRWEPQDPHAYVPFDPYNRYWSQNVPQSHMSQYGREDFGNSGIFENFGKGNGNGNGMNTETLLQIILFILVALFIIQLVECLYTRCTTE
jgi:hypothetical protein